MILERVWSLLAPASYILAVLIIFQFVCVQIAIGFYENPVTQNSFKSASTANLKAASGLPVRIKIPSIRVDAVIRNVGLTSDGSMGVPALPRDAAWYMLGPKPGEKGSAVISGHVNWWYGVKGVFERLKALKPGDKITVQNDRGISTSFVVRKIREYGQKDDASDVFFSFDGKSHLNLVTCSGVWDRLSKAYSKRLVVFTDKVAE
ncbi:MAG: class F sortase [Patescibacteria group bacterium]